MIIKRKLIFFGFLFVFFFSFSSNLLADEHRIVRAGSEYDYPPFCIVNDKGDADGFSVELLRESLRVVGFDVIFKVGPWAKIKEELKDGQIDVLPLVARSPEREVIYDFTFTYMPLHGGIFVRKGDTRIKSVADLADKELIVMKGDSAEEYVLRENISSKIFPVATYALAMKLLSSGKHDAVIAQKLMGDYILKDKKIKGVVSLDQPLNNFRQDFAFAVRDGDIKLLSQLNEGLSIVMADGTFEKLHEKWFVPLMGRHLKIKDILKYIFYIIIPFILILAVLIVIFLRIEIKRKTYNLAKSEEKYRSIVDNIGIGIALISPDMKILSLNKQMREWFPSIDDSSKPICYKAFNDPPRDEICSYCPTCKTLMDGQVHQDTTETPVGDEIRKYRIISAPIIENGKVTAAIEMVEDITDQIKAEEQKQYFQKQLFQSQKMEAVGTLSSGIAHNFNNILGAIRGSVELASEDVGKETRIYTDLARAMSGIENAQELIGQMMTFSRATDAKLSLIEIAPVVKESLNLFNASVKGRIAISENIDPDCGYIMANANQIQHIVLNLLNNSLHAIKKSSVEIEVSLSRVTVDKKLAEQYKDLKSGEYVLLIIKDNGYGIDKDTLSRIFDPFFTTKEVGKGTGLGLSMVHGIVESYGGMIKVESELGKGTSISIYFPKEVV
ncbi:MAG: transporter substrate-binding domain-containing protein [Candidatus Omnitrophica bacterium]|nr:transporter substrate-binding domain-containing protein [Candidatus Omnitrophota bacterium]